jgi:uncharacterized phage-associated protein
VHFQFDSDKFVACAAMFAAEPLRDLGRMKLCKLMYFADKHHLVRYGRPIIGDMYIRYRHGPVPSLGFAIMGKAITGSTAGPEAANFLKRKFLEYLRVKKTSGAIRAIFEVKRPPAVEYLSQSEQESIRETVKRYGRCSPYELRNLTHEEPSYTNTPEGEDIDYKLFFEQEREAVKGAFEYMESMPQGF